MVDVYNYIIRVVYILTFIYLRYDLALRLYHEVFIDENYLVIIDATRSITTKQHNVANAVNGNNNREMDHPSSAPPPEEEPPD